jgi:predicted alpha-1,6-mannanase (GH76 family)
MVPPSLSALLAESTSDPTYLQAAEQSATFIQAHLLSIENVVQDTISGRANDSCALHGGPVPYNSGLMIEALAILASITKNATTQALYVYY